LSEHIIDGYYNSMFDLHRENEPTQTRAKNDFDSAPRFPSQGIKVASECDSWQYVGEENINRARQYLLVKQRPV
jgi:hypothetical protein